MKIVAFAGPSLPHSARDTFCSIEWRRPAEAGDLLDVDARLGTSICLIDGYFDHRPAVRHKEILFLLSLGVQIFGASSIGALRAAEMARYGMVGVGSIYAAYARGTIVADDEVALIHAPEDHDWRPLSLPLVDLRATLCRAVRNKALNLVQAKALLQAGAAIHYVDRDWASVLATGAGPAEFDKWLATGRVELKRLDAIRCVRLALSYGTFPAARPQLVMTPFLAGLASERGIDLEARWKEAQSHTVGSALPPLAAGGKHD